MSNPDLSQRRRYPRKEFYRQVGFLFNGEYHLVNSAEIGEGGLSFFSEKLFPIGEDAVLSFQVPGGSFISIRAEVRHSKSEMGGMQYIIGCQFKNIQFDTKREIRFYISSQSEKSLYLAKAN